MLIYKNNINYIDTSNSQHCNYFITEQTTQGTFMNSIACYKFKLSLIGEDRRLINNYLFHQSLFCTDFKMMFFKNDIDGICMMVIDGFTLATHRRIPSKK